MGGTWVGGGLGQREALPGIRSRAGRPQGAEGLDALLEEVEPGARPGEREPVCRVLPLPPPRAETAERPAAREGVERRDGLGDDPGASEGHGADEGAEVQPGVESGEQAEGDVGLGDRVPGPSDLGDLHEVVHEGEAGEAEGVGGQRHVAQPGRRAGTPREGRELEHHPGRGSDRGEDADPRIGHGDPGWCDLGRSRTVLRLHDDDRVPRLRLELGRDSAGALQLVAQDPGRHPAVATGVALVADLSRGVEADRDRGKPCGPGLLAPPSTARGVETEGVDDHREAPAGPRGDHAVEHVEGVDGRVEVSRARPDDGAQGVRRDDLDVAVPRGRPRRLARPRGADEHHEGRVRQRPRRHDTGVASARTLRGIGLR